MESFSPLSGFFLFFLVFLCLWGTILLINILRSRIAFRIAFGFSPKAKVDEPTYQLEKNLVNHKLKEITDTLLSLRHRREEMRQKIQIQPIKLAPEDVKTLTRQWKKIDSDVKFMEGRFKNAHQLAKRRGFRNRTETTEDYFKDYGTDLTTADKLLKEIGLR